MSIHSGLKRDEAARMLTELADAIRDDQRYAMASIMHTRPMECAGVTDRVYLGQSFVLSTRPISFDQEQKIREILEGLE